MQRRFHLGPFTYTTPQALAEYVYRQMKLIAQAVQGAVDVSAGNSGTAISIDVGVADQTTLMLTGNTTVTLVTTNRKRAQEGDIEFTQDAVGGRTVAFVNLVGSVPAIAAGIGKRTLVAFTNIGPNGYVAFVKATNY